MADEVDLSAFPEERREDVSRLVSWWDEAGPVLDGWDDPNIEKLSPHLRAALVDLGYDAPALKHPWVNQPFGIMVGQSNKMLTAKVGMMRKYLAPSERNLVGYLVCVVERPWRVDIVARWWRRGNISVEELRDCLEFVWTDTELPSKNLDLDEIVGLFHAAGFVTDDEDGVWEKLPPMLEVYRGGPISGISWTLDREKAKWFAERFAQDHPLWKSTVAKADALAFFTGRGESEVVCDRDVAERAEQIR